MPSWLYQPLRPMTDADIAALTVIPGVYWRIKGPVRGHFEAATNAAWLVEAIAANIKLPLRAKPPIDADLLTMTLPWSVVRQLLSLRGEVRETIADRDDEIPLDDYAMAHQKDALGFAATRPGVHFWHVPGSGKTFTLTLWALLRPGAVLIVTRNGAKRQFAGEVERFTHLKPFILKAKNEYRKRDQWRSLEQYIAWCAEVNQRPFVIMSWEGLPSYKDEILRWMTGAPGLILGLDESQKGKNQKRSKRLVDENGKDKYVDLGNIVDCASKIAKVAYRKAASTGTPIKNRLCDLWGQLDLIEPWGHGSYRSWTTRYCDGHMGRHAWDATGMSNVDELLARLSFVTHRVSAEQLADALPPMRRTSRYLGPDEQDRPYNYAGELKAAMKRGPTAVLEVRLAESASMKRSAVVEMVAERLTAGQKIVVFTARIRDCEELGAAISKAAKNAKVWVASGADADSDDREEIRQEFMAYRGACCLVGTGDAWGTAYNLNDADAAFFVMLPWAPGDLDQWERRFVRLSGKRSVEIIYVICEGTVDEVVVSKLISKLPAVERVSGDKVLASAYIPLTGTDDRVKLAESMMSQLAAVAESAVLEEDVRDAD